ncbi:bcl-2-binding component 3 [Thalassophryne amazonica]|uniref:bcl-2-binding component 3 n=1 Tax=Thalassophryne amazonica TaxID=390379 RepID=UPI0014726110|nr:bcl-2-binding component 3 [Thalassophryne amazonica]
MARANTIKSVRDNRGGVGGGPLPSHRTCHVKSPWSFCTRPGLLTHTISTDNGTSTGTYLHHCPHHLHRHPAPYLTFMLPYRHPAGLQEPPNLQHLPLLSAPPWFKQREDCGEAESVTTVGESASDSGDNQDALRQQRPPLDLLLPIERPSWYSRQLRGEEDQDVQVRRVGTQLRTIGDKFNSTILNEVHAAANWQDWRDVYRGLLDFITQTLNAFWRIT